MARLFALTIHLHDQRYHGAGEWPPAPARVFQALVAGSAQGRHVASDAARALELLESLPAPIIAAPSAIRGQRVSLFVPNNDLDAVDGDPARVGEVRARKAVHPHLLENEPSFLYAWRLPELGGDELVTLAEGLYQLGRGVDPAWAVGEVLDEEQLASRLRAHRGVVHRPTSGDGSSELAVPTTGSFESIARRFEATLIRLRPSGDGRTNFVQPPRAHFVMVRYNGAPSIHLFELRRESEPAKSSPWATWRATALIEHIRDTAVSALSNALPERRAVIERVLVGRKPDGTNAGALEQRVRFVPLPSIGHAHADHSIRRVLVQVPPGPLAEADVLWAVAGRSLLCPETSATGDTTLAAARVDEMVERYRFSSRIWRSVTPLALGTALRRRIEPTRQRQEAKSSVERNAEEQSARHAIARALRHAQVEGLVVRVHVQREPFEAHGTRAERFAEGTRFAKESLWHVELKLDRAIQGPLVLGDGRFLGLGVMVPQIERGVFALEVEGGLAADTDTSALARSLRRAVMARVQTVLGVRGEGQLPAYFHGHSSDGKPLSTSSSTHLAFSVDIPSARLLVVPPHVLDGWETPRRDATSHLDALEQALDGFTTLRAGRAGVLSLRSSRVSPSDSLFRPANSFRSVSDYAVCRHTKKSTAAEMVAADVRRECERRKLPRPTAVRVTRIRGVRGVGVVAHVQLDFAVAVRGPILLGKTRYLGGGLFRAAEERSALSSK